MSWVQRERLRSVRRGGGGSRGGWGGVSLALGKRVERCGDVAARMSSRVLRVEKSIRGYGGISGVHYDHGSE